jgi:hypothetical protein
MVPVPEVVSLAQPNAMIEQWDEEDERRRIGTRPRPGSEYFSVERPLLQPLADEPFETGRLFSLRVDRFSQISVRTNRYSVPVRLIGRTFRAMLHASELVVYDGQQEVARHERLITKGQRGLVKAATRSPVFMRMLMQVLFLTTGRHDGRDSRIIRPQEPDHPDSPHIEPARARRDGSRGGQRPGLAAEGGRFREQRSRRRRTQQQLTQNARLGTPAERLNGLLVA